MAPICRYSTYFVVVSVVELSIEVECFRLFAQEILRFGSVGDGGLCRQTDQWAHDLISHVDNPSSPRAFLSDLYSSS
jgi:hypothetical protein